MMNVLFSYIVYFSSYSVSELTKTKYSWAILKPQSLATRYKAFAIILVFLIGDTYGMYILYICYIVPICEMLTTKNQHFRLNFCFNIIMMKY